MNILIPVFILVVVTSAAICAVLASAAWQHRSSLAAAAFAASMIEIAGYALGYAFELAIDDLPGKMLAIKFQYIFTATLPVMWLIFALAYTEEFEHWLARHNIALLLIIPLTTIVLVWTHEHHDLFWRRIDLVREGTFWVLDTVRGPWFWVSIAYSYLCLLLGTLLLVRAFLRRRALYRGQTTMLLAGALMPWVGNAVLIFDLSPLDWTPILFTIGGVFLLWGVFRLQLFDLVPVAHDVMIEHMSDGVIVLDARQRIVDINPAACEQLCLSKTQNIIGQPIDHIFVDQQDPIKRYQDDLETESEIVVQRGETPRYFDLRLSELRKRERLTGYLIVLRDITDRKRVEQELNAFAHTAAHDLKNPISATYSLADTLINVYPHWDDEKRLDYIQRIRDNAHRMNNIIESLLLFASVRRLDEVDVETIDMAAVVSEALERLAFMITQYEAEIIVPDVWPAAQGYGPWIEEVWVNYINNALKYGGKPPRVELGADLKPAQNMVRFWVRDNGPGLTREAQRDLFVPFTRNAKGHGLGLSIAYRIVERLGGKVSIESVIEEGSTFSFTLPAAHAPAAE